MGGQRELKDAAGRIGARPQSPAVRFNDRTADRQAQPQAAWFCRVEGLQEILESGRRQSRARVANQQSPNSVLPVEISSSRDPSLNSLMASTALRIKLRITCCSS